jgi:hypothetical protein
MKTLWLYADTRGIVIEAYIGVSHVVVERKHQDYFDMAKLSSKVKISYISYMNYCKIALDDSGNFMYIESCT